MCWKWTITAPELSHIKLKSALKVDNHCISLSTIALQQPLTVNGWSLLQADQSNLFLIKLQQQEVAVNGWSLCWVDGPSQPQPATVKLTSVLEVNQQCLSPLHAFVQTHGQVGQRLVICGLQQLWTNKHTVCISVIFLFILISQLCWPSVGYSSCGQTSTQSVFLSFFFFILQLCWPSVGCSSCGQTSTQCVFLSFFFFI